MTKKMKLIFAYLISLFVPLIMMLIIICLDKFKNYLNKKILKMYTSSRDTIKDKKYIRKKLRRERTLWIIDIVISFIPVIIIFFILNIAFKINNFKTSSKINFALISTMGVIINWSYEYFKGDKLISRAKIKEIFFKFIEFDEKIGNINVSIKKLKKEKSKKKKEMKEKKKEKSKKKKEKTNMENDKEKKTNEKEIKEDETEVKDTNKKDDTEKTEDKEEKAKKPLYKKWWFWLIIIVVVIATIAYISYIIYRLIHVPKNVDYIVKLATPFVALIAAIGAIISYFIKNESEKEDRENTRKIQVHSEAQWRKRLFDLVEKEELTKNDVIYFLSFFNSNNPTSEIDKLLMDICYYILVNNNTSEEIDELFNKIKCFNIKQQDKQDERNGDAKTIKDIKKNYVSRFPLYMTLDKQLLFRAAINLLLKKDWYRQNNKE